MKLLGYNKKNDNGKLIITRIPVCILRNAKTYLWKNAFTTHYFIKKVKKFVNNLKKRKKNTHKKRGKTSKISNNYFSVHIFSYKLNKLFIKIYLNHLNGGKLIDYKGVDYGISKNEDDGYD
jgi:c-di-AMP phosphodiesterase-like protein